MIVTLNKEIYNKKINQKIFIDFLYDWDDEIEYPDGSIFFKTHDVGDESEIIDKAIKELKEYNTFNDLAIYFYTKVINLDYIEIEGKRITREEVDIPKNAPKYKLLNKELVLVGKKYTLEDFDKDYNQLKEWDTKELIDLIDSYTNYDHNDIDITNYVLHTCKVVNKILKERNK